MSSEKLKGKEGGRQRRRERKLAFIKSLKCDRH